MRALLLAELHHDDCRGIKIIRALRALDINVIDLGVKIPERQGDPAEILDRLEFDKD